MSIATFPPPSQPDDLQSLIYEHSLYSRRVEMLQEKKFCTQSEQMEEVRLKKLKLRLKDEIEARRREPAEWLRTA